MKAQIYTIMSLCSLMFTKLMAIPYIFSPVRLGQQHWLIVLIAIMIINGLTMTVLRRITGLEEDENKLVSYIKRYFGKQEQGAEEPQQEQEQEH